MGRRLPSLNALKAFEAAARHVSFTEAADELFVTHAAISRHIKELEEYFGTPLFIRTGRGVNITETGQALSERLTPLFDGLAEATREAMITGTQRKLNVSVQPAIASRWLVPRLGRFHDMHPDIELSIDPTNRLVDFRVDEIDVGIRYGRGRWEDTEAAKLSDIICFPVCSPELIAENPGLTLLDLKDYTLLHEERKSGWEEWLAHAEVTPVGDWKGTTFHNHLAIEAAEAGQGFALGEQILCLDALLEGWLVRPFDCDVKDQGSYFIVRAKGSKESATVRAFREWLLLEMGETNKKYAAFKAAQKNLKTHKSL